MKKAFTLSIPEPCTQRWDQMQTRDCGRFCAVCEKTVLDFTAFSDEAFIAFFQQTTVIPCGRFTQRQFSLVVPAKKRPLLSLEPYYKYAAALGIAIAGFPLWSAGQDIKTEQHAINTQKKAGTVPVKAEVTRIKGRVVDKDGVGVLMAAVSCAETGESVYSDMDGNFELVLDKLNGATASLKVSVLGLGEVVQEVPLSGATGKEPVVITMKEEPLFLGGAMTTEVHQKGLWYRLTKPFRKSINKYMQTQANGVFL